MSIRDHLEAFLEHMVRLEETDDRGEDGYFKEYTQLRQLTQKYRQKQTIPATEGKKECNIKKNRYKDIVPYDKTRVKLSNLDGVEGRDYINANFIKSPLGHNCYIAAQGPLPQTVADFVRLLWEYEVGVVIMACNEYEANKHKCQRYWPNSTDEELAFGPVKITLGGEVRQHSSGAFTERSLVLKVPGEKERVVSHFHFLAWPDHMVPASVEVLLDVIAEARARQPSPTSPPLLVHCSAGCGRTGTIIAVDYIWTLLKYAKLDEKFSIFEIIKSMRTQRPSVVQSPEQYIFLHLTIKELFEKHLRIMDQHIYENCTTGAGGGGPVGRGGGEELYQDVGGMQQGPGLHSQVSVGPKSPSQVAIEETADKLAELELSSRTLSSSTPDADDDDDNQELYAQPALKKKPSKPPRPPVLPVYENDKVSLPPPLPPKTEEASQLVEENAEKAERAERSSPDYTNTQPQKPPTKAAKPAVNGKRPALPNFKPEKPPSPKPETNPFKQGLVASVASVTPKSVAPMAPVASQSQKPNFAATQPLVPTPIAVKSPRTNPFNAKPVDNTPLEGYTNVVPTQIPSDTRNTDTRNAETRSTNSNVTLINLGGGGGNESQITHSQNREPSKPNPLLEDYSTLSDCTSGGVGIPQAPGFPKSHVRESTLDNPDYSLVKNPVYGDPNSGNTDQDYGLVKNPVYGDPDSGKADQDYGLVKNPVYGDPEPSSQQSQPSQQHSQHSQLTQNSQDGYSLAKPMKHTSAPAGRSGASFDMGISSDYSSISEWSSADASARAKSSSSSFDTYEPVDSVPAPNPNPNPIARKPPTDDTYATADDTYATADGSYAYAGENARNKWSLQHIALQNEAPAPPRSKPPSKPSEGGDAYEAVSFDQNEDDVFGSITYEQGEGSEEEDDPAGRTSNTGTSNFGTLTKRAFGQMFRKKGCMNQQEMNFGTLGKNKSSSGGSNTSLSTDWQAFTDIHIYFKRSDLSYPNKLRKPKGHRMNPNIPQPHNPGPKSAQPRR